MAAPARVESASAEVAEELLVTDQPVGRRGGRLVTALRAEPKTLNPLIALDIPSQTVIRRLTADLIHIDRHTQETVPALAKSWQISDDGRVYTLNLRRGIRFSDGQPFDADDVIFTFRVLQDEKVGSPQRDLLAVGGKPIEARKLDSHTVEMRLAQPYAVAERLFDGVAMLPEHRLREDYEEARLNGLWPVTAPAGEVVGLGPFRLKEYVPGQHCIVERNPYYWKVDQAGVRLPYFDELVFLFVASDDAQVLRFQVGATDVIDRLSGENFAALEQQAERRSHRLEDLGPGLGYDFLFFNQNDLSQKSLPEIVAKQSWFRKADFRRAVSAAVDRQAIVRLAFHGHATPLWSHVTPGNKRWVNSAVVGPRRSIERARELLTDAGFSWTKDQALVDGMGQVVEFSIITSSSNNQRIKMASIIQNDLKELGMKVHLVAIEHRALVARVLTTFEYEACILGLIDGDADPNPQMPLLLSDGHLHFWNLEGVSTLWESEIDRLMREQIAILDYRERKKLFDKVQILMSEYLPIINLVSPHDLVGAKRNLGNFRPTILRHPTLWNAEEVFWRAVGE